MPPSWLFTEKGKVIDSLTDEVINVNISKYQAFLCAAELGSFTKAAEKLGYTQSGLTHMMNSLEEEIGFPLLRRGYFGVRLTPNGQRLLPKIQELATVGKELDALIEELRQDGCEVLRIGSFSSMTLHWLPSIVQQYNRDFPNVRVELTSGSVDDLYEGLQSDQFDLVFISKNKKITADWIPLWEDQLLAIFPKTFPLQHKDAIPLEVFNGQRFLMPGLGFNLDLLRIFDQRNVSPDIISTSLDDPFILSMVEHELGVSILSELILKERNNDVIARPLNPPAFRYLGIAVLPGRKRESYIQTFISYAKHFAEHFEI